ncbi:MAG: T9SS type A sorting domain-containing protein [Flavobacteriales bacterium]|nr:T9SS type A sorting domain-containing protein [Flavobacteriales bacterium]
MKIFLNILFFLGGTLAYGQNFITPVSWKWATLNYSCPPEIVNFPTGLDYSSGPKCMKIDSMGNVYLLGLIQVSTGMDYTLAANTTNSNTFTQNNPFITNAGYSFYLLKLDSTGQLVWCKDIVTAGIWEGMSFELFVDAKTSTSLVLCPTGSEIIFSGQKIRTQGTSGAVFSFDLNGNLIDTTWYVNNLTQGDSASFLYSKPGLWPNQFDVVKHTLKGDELLKTFNYSIPQFIYNPFENQYFSLSFGSDVIRVFDSKLNQIKNIQLTGDVPDMKGTSFDIVFKPNGDFMILYLESANKVHKLLYIDSTYQCKWSKYLGNSAAFDADGNPWSYYSNTGLVAGKRVFPYRGTSSVAVKLNPLNGEPTGDYISPSYTSYCLGSDDFCIDSKNRFYMSGTFRYEIEFGNTVLSHICNNKAYGRTQYVAMASPGKEINRLTSKIGKTEMESGVFLYPNPTTDFINFDIEEKVNEITAISLDGRQTALIFENDKIDVSNLESGIYALEIKTDSGVFRGKVVKI